jgi:NitT/TauT family transport system ATP-binding protein
LENYKIELDGITKTFYSKNGSINAVSNASFKVKDKDFISLVGPSGCGKSTIIRILNGIISPTEGSITYSGVKFNNGIIKGNILKKLGFVFQTPNLMPWLTIRKNLELPLEVLNLKGPKWQANIDRLLDMVNMHEYADAYPVSLSDGMLQKVGVIRAMVHDPEILFLDEPFGALDEITREQLDMATQSLWQETKKTIIFITHNIQEAVLLSSKAIVMGTNPGRILKEVEIGLPRPRTVDMITTDKFIECEDEITDLIGKVSLDKIK